MSQKEMSNWCRKEYNLNGNTKIRNIDIDKKQFTIRLGDCMADIPFPKSLVRELKLNMIL
jgi:hypothetical protein